MMEMTPNTPQSEGMLSKKKSSVDSNLMVDEGLYPYTIYVLIEFLGL